VRAYYYAKKLIIHYINQINLNSDNKHCQDNTPSYNSIKIKAMIENINKKQEVNKFLIQEQKKHFMMSANKGNS
jgi:hypothetical protein